MHPEVAGADETPQQARVGVEVGLDEVGSAGEFLAGLVPAADEAGEGEQGRG